MKKVIILFLAVVVGGFFFEGNAQKTKKQKQHNETQKVEVASVSNYLVNSITDSIHKVSAADSARYYQMVLSVCDMIRQKVVDYDQLNLYMTPKGYSDYCKLMKSNSVYVISTDVCRFVRLGTDVQCRSVPMTLTTSEGNNYTDNIVFTINENTNKIDGISFALNERYIRRIMGDTEIDETARIKLVTFMEKYQTAYFQKDWDFIESIFTNYHPLPNNYEYIKINKNSYLERLRKTNKECIHLQLSDLRAEMSFQKDLYVITFVQDYYSANDGDHGYVFLLVDMADTSAEPVVRFTVFNTETTDGKIPFTMSDYDTLCGKTAK